MSASEQAILAMQHQLTAFIALLEEEAIALAAQNTDTLATLLPRRNEAHRQLAQAWTALASAAGITPTSPMPAVREALFAQRPPNPAWQTLEQLTHDADKLNRVNGRLIEAQMQRTETAMQVLRNNLAHRGVYGSDGRVSNVFQSTRSIDQV